MLLNCLMVGVGGFIGSVCRYLVGLLPVEAGQGFPIKTLCINVIGAFVISVITALAAKNKSMSPELVLMLRVGVCGGFTTFSTFAYESVDLIKGGNTAVALAYICASVILSILAVFAGQTLVK